jgi:nitrous oxide reductase
MSTKSRSETKGRRAFLRQLAAVGGATATVAVAGTAVAAPEIEPKAAPETETKGYRVTQHVSTYYDKARF